MFKKSLFSIPNPFIHYINNSLDNHLPNAISFASVENFFPEQEGQPSTEFISVFGDVLKFKPHRLH